MNEQDFQFLTDLRSALYTISTTGRDTMIMGRCLESLDQFIINKEKEMSNKKEE